MFIYSIYSITTIYYLDFHRCPYMSIDVHRCPVGLWVRFRLQQSLGATSRSASVAAIRTLSSESARAPTNLGTTCISPRLKGSIKTSETESLLSCIFKRIPRIKHFKEVHALAWQTAWWQWWLPCEPRRHGDQNSSSLPAQSSCSSVLRKFRLETSQLKGSLAQRWNVPKLFWWSWWDAYFACSPLTFWDLGWLFRNRRLLSVAQHCP